MHEESAKDRWERVKSILEEVLEAKAEDRTAILESRCASDPDLRAEVESLLAAHDEVAAGGDFFGTSEDPQQVGRYRIVRPIGRGGMGVVYLAEQIEPVRREVAVKLIQAGLSTHEIVARFELERQALAILDHPHIAKVLDAGATEAGRPFFVMEFCPGEPIDAYCDRNRLSLDERLELFGQVCSAVQHAHTKGIIHRDLKPGNVLVSTQDGKPHARVIDFGIAKATAGKLTDRTILTEYRTMMGTPEYMSPEQAEGSRDIDTRTDVYSLGVMLYELLTGTTPFTREALRDAAQAEVHRIIREVEPPRPSTRVTGTPDTISGIAANRRTDPGKLRTLLRGDLDWIVMKCLEKDRDRRYETANGLAMDLRRHLAREAVLAAPPSVSYRVRKFVRRHRVMVGAGAAVAAALLLGAVAFAWQARIARAQRDLAIRARDELKLAANFQTDMLVPLDLAVAEPVVSMDATRRFAEAMATASVPEAEKIRSFSNLSHLLQLQGRYDDAELLGREALQRSGRVRGAEHPDTIVLMGRLGSLLALQGSHRQAIDLLIAAEELARKSSHRRRQVILAGILGALGRALTGLGDDRERFEQAESKLLEAYAILIEELGQKHKETLDCAASLADLYSWWDQSEPGRGFGVKAAHWREKLRPPRVPR